LGVKIQIAARSGSKSHRIQTGKKWGRAGFSEREKNGMDKKRLFAVIIDKIRTGRKAPGAGHEVEAGDIL
jgi:hypothetical protein